MKNARFRIVKAVLSILAVTSGVIIVITAPNLFQVFSAYGNFPKSRNWNIRTSIKSMHKKGLIKFSKDKILITSRGKVVFKRLCLNDIDLGHKQSDGLVRLIIFDVPEYLHRTRNVFTSKLRQLGFSCLQKSVWIIDKPCKQEIKELSKVLGIESFIRIATVSKIEKVT